jgi:hypothetical protein
VCVSSVGSGGYGGLKEGSGAGMGSAQGMPESNAYAGAAQAFHMQGQYSGYGAPQASAVAAGSVTCGMFLGWRACCYASCPFLRSCCCLHPREEQLSYCPQGRQQQGNFGGFGGYTGGGYGGYGHAPNGDAFKMQ